MWRYVLTTRLVPGERQRRWRAQPQSASRPLRNSSPNDQRRRVSRSSFRHDPTIWDGRFANNGWLPGTAEADHAAHVGHPCWRGSATTASRAAKGLARTASTSGHRRRRAEVRGERSAKRCWRIVARPSRRSRSPCPAATAASGAGRVGTSADTRRASSTSTGCAPPTRCSSAAGARDREGRRVPPRSRTQEHHLMEGARPGARRDASRSAVADPESSHAAG